MWALFTAVSGWAGAVLPRNGSLYKKLFPGPFKVQMTDWRQHFILEFGGIDSSLPKEGLGYPLFKYLMRIFCGANTETNVFRGVRGKANVTYLQHTSGIYHSWMNRDSHKQ